MVIDWRSRVFLGLALAAMLALEARAAQAQGLGKLGINLLADHVPLSAQIAHDAVVPWVRLIAFWRGIQWDPNADDYSELDNEVTAALQANQRILINFATIPWWANGDPVDCDWLEGECTHPPTDPQFF